MDFKAGDVVALYIPYINQDYLYKIISATHVETVDGTSYKYRFSALSTNTLLRLATPAESLMFRLGHNKIPHNDRQKIVPHTASCEAGSLGASLEGQ